MNFCDLIKKYANLAFWKCLSKEEQDKVIVKHKASLKNADEVEEIQSLSNNYKKKYFDSQDKLIEIQKKINQGTSLSELKLMIDEFLKDK